MGMNVGPFYPQGWQKPGDLVSVLFWQLPPYPTLDKSFPFVLITQSRDTHLLHEESMRRSALG